MGPGTSWPAATNPQRFGSAGQSTPGPAAPGAEALAAAVQATSAIDAHTDSRPAVPPDRRPGRRSTRPGAAQERQHHFGKHRLDGEKQCRAQEERQRKEGRFAVAEGRCCAGLSLDCSGGPPVGLSVAIRFSFLPMAGADDHSLADMLVDSVILSRRSWRFNRKTVS